MRQNSLPGYQEARVIPRQMHGCVGMMQEVLSQLWAGWTRTTVLKLGFTVWLVVTFMKLFAAPTHAGLVV
ncbi:hypothetical protein CC77DRAFT_1019470 [Alternaria alternata]|uniref:Uncharacterized protein n=1 Tax=Alternaria alternata TaxID=5599 RepID=A0A177DQ76_ALTAL|nr:hypothetical protein CC77DRAFT_1019470 [Alternaria alternata]OAG21538.1 hypothetical protein CC77DRAFT_1019470 [Alternaria alternata]